MDWLGKLGVLPKPRMAFHFVIAFLFVSAQLTLAGTSTFVSQGPSVGIYPTLIQRLSEIDSIVEKAVAQRCIPGAVVSVAHQGNVIFERAYGNRSLEPVIEPMTVDTIFDLASLTKVVATTPAVMILLQQGKLSLDDRVAKYIPAFAQRGKGKITIRDLLTHYSGLPPDLRLSGKRQSSAKSILTKIYRVKPVSPPGKRFIYSDLGFIVLGKIVERVSGKTLDAFTQENIFFPLGMSSTRFLCSGDFGLIAPTEKRKDGGVMRGQVHDPLAAKLGGVAGDAGLFSRSRDLTRFCQMLLQQGMFDGVQILKPETVEKMISPQSPPEQPNLRGLGWDIHSIYSSAKGNYFSSRSYGHTGYTGTSLWIDPETQTFLIILTNRVHPNGKGDVKELRIHIADIVGAAVRPSSEDANPRNSKIYLENSETNAPAYSAK